MKTDERNKLLMLVKDNRLLVNEYIEKNGLIIHGSAIYPSESDGPVGKVLPETKLERRYYKAIEAFQNTTLIYAIINVYIGNIPDESIRKLRLVGFDITEHNVLRIFTLIIRMSVNGSLSLRTCFRADKLKI